MAVLLFFLSIFFFYHLDPVLSLVVAIFGTIFFVVSSKGELTEEEREERKKSIEAGVEVTSFWGNGGNGGNGGACGGACGACGGG